MFIIREVTKGSPDFMYVTPSSTNEIFNQQIISASASASASFDTADRLIVANTHPDMALVKKY